MVSVCNTTFETRAFKVQKEDGNAKRTYRCNRTLRALACAPMDTATAYLSGNRPISEVRLPPAQERFHMHTQAPPEYCTPRPTTAHLRGPRARSL